MVLLCDVALRHCSGLCMIGYLWYCSVILPIVLHYGVACDVAPWCYPKVFALCCCHVVVPAMLP